MEGSYSGGSHIDRIQTSNVKGTNGYGVEKEKDGVDLIGWYRPIR